MNHYLQGTIAILLIASFAIAVTAGAFIYADAFGSAKSLLPMSVLLIDGLMAWFGFSLASKILAYPPR